MAAYAALVSLMNIIHDIQRHHSRPISLDPQQLQSLTQVLTFLQELFLEAYNSPVADGDEADPLEMRITDAAYAAEDVIESHIVDNIRLQNQQTSSPADSDEPDISERLRAVGAEDVIESRIVEMLRAVVAERQLLEMARAVGAEDVIESQIVDKIHLQNQQTSSHADSDEPDISEQISGSFNCFRAPKKPENVDDEQIRSINFYQDLQRVIEEMDSIKLAAMKIDTGKAVVVRDRDVSASAAPLRSSSYSSDMVYPEAVIRGIMDKLTTGNSHLDLQVIPIVGMGGIGKTTLARNIYACKLIQEHFPVCAWATVSQQYNTQYNTREILCEVFSQATKKNKEELIEMSEATLGTELRKYLYGRKFLIVVDDMWSIDAWENIKHFFPNNKNDSRILVYLKYIMIFNI